MAATDAGPYRCRVSSDLEQTQSAAEQDHVEGVTSRMNWLRAGVLGANDGIVSTAGLVVGVAGATSDRAVILTAGVAGLVAGALSMATGELTEKDAFAAHVDAELGIDPDDLTNPWHAALASAIAFTVGALLPLLAIELPPPSARVPVTFVAVLVALALTGWISARLGSAGVARALRRNVLGGALAMAVTYGIGLLVGSLGL